ncbi:MAG: DUF3362 domain-containing protein, partial [Clostridia bacterium]|nr:DUF3362 domain-containing protein [Clostridia bacterium]
GPTANFRYPSCDRQKENGVCKNRKCLSPTPCKHLKVDHKEYAHLLREIEALPGIKKVFVRSGIRFDYLIYDDDDSFFRQLVSHHVSGQLKVAPEHCANNTLMMMGKPPIEVYEKFKKKYFALCDEAGLEQYLVPYLMSSHPGTTINDAVEMATWLKKWGYMPEQVQDFYPTPGTISTVMYYTGINPMNGKKVYVTTDYHEKQLQRALLQYSKPENANLVREALKLAGREDLIGNSPECLVRPSFSGGRYIPEKKLSHPSKSQGAKGKRGKASASVAHGTKTAASGKKKSTKFDRIFGDDADRIRREAEKMSKKDSPKKQGAKSFGKPSSKSAKSKKR